MKFSKYILIILISGLFASCEDYLEPEPTAAVALVDGQYTTAQEVDLGLIAIYNAVQGVNDNQFDELKGIQAEYFVTEMLSDNTSTRTPDGDGASFSSQFESFTVAETNTIVANYYASMYRIVYLSNLILDSVDRGIVSSESEGQARFFRGYAYFNLIRSFGEDSQDWGVPLIDRVVVEGDELSFIRASEDDVYDLIIEDLTFASAALDNSSKNTGSKGAAHTLLAKVYLTLDEPDYISAILNLDQVYGEYSLQENYVDIFGYANELNDEIIYSVGFEDTLINDSQIYSADFFGVNGSGSSGNNYLTNDLFTKLSDPAGQGGANRQLYGFDMADTTIKYPIIKHISTGTGWADAQDQPLQGGCDWIVLRYADVILMYAEAYMGDAETLDIRPFRWASDYDLIRTRAGLDVVTEITKEELLAERRFEFFGENKRLHDLKRFGVATQVLTEFSNLAENQYSFSEGSATLPIPLREINISPLDSSGQPLLEQNLGWR